MKHPRIYIDIYQVTIQIFNRTKSFPKHLRPTLGRKLEEAGLDCLLHIQKSCVTSKEYRLTHLRNASDSLDNLKTLIQISRDLNALCVQGLSELSKLTIEIGKEIGGFIKSEKY
jgi:four helix bundle protein